MLELTENRVADALSQAMETMAFVSPLPPENPVVLEAPAIVTCIEFSGDVSGRLEIVCPLKLGAVLASNILACDPTDADALAAANDSLRELANVTCGAFLRGQLAQTQLKVDMTVPVQTPFDPNDFDAFVAAGACVLDADGIGVAAKFTEKA